MTRWNALALSAALIAVPAYVAHAQDARSVLEASGEAIVNSKGFGAQFRLYGEGSDMIKATMPSLNGRFVFGRTDSGPVIHMLGEAKDGANSDAYAFDLVRTTDKITWTDDTKKTISTRKAQPESRDLINPGRLIHMGVLLHDKPFDELLSKAETVAGEGTKDVAGVNCDVVLVTLAKQPPSRGAPAHTAERWFIGASDHLPRRVEQITDGGMIKFSLITEFSGLNVGVQAPAMLDVRRPEGYAVDDRTVAATPKPPPTGTPDADKVEQGTPKPGVRPTRMPERPQAPALTNAPVFSFTDDGGRAVDNNSQMGRVSVFYFWGTWCIPCRDVSPKVSALADAFSGKDVDVFGLAIRERDKDAAKSYFSDQGYKHRLVLGEGKTANAFHVRMYPTVVVVDQKGAIVYDASLTKERDAARLADETKAAVEKALAG